MITDYNVTACYEDECYENYYIKSKNWDEYYNSLAEREDTEREDSCDG